MIVALLVIAAPGIIVAHYLFRRPPVGTLPFVLLALFGGFMLSVASIFLIPYSVYEARMTTESPLQYARVKTVSEQSAPDDVDRPHILAFGWPVTFYEQIVTSGRPFGRGLQVEPVWDRWLQLLQLANTLFYALLIIVVVVVAGRRQKHANSQ